MLVSDSWVRTQRILRWMYVCVFSTVDQTVCSLFSGTKLCKPNCRQNTQRNTASVGPHEHTHMQRKKLQPPSVSTKQQSHLIFQGFVERQLKPVWLSKSTATRKFQFYHNTDTMTSIVLKGQSTPEPNYIFFFLPVVLFKNLHCCGVNCQVLEILAKEMCAFSPT